MEALQGKILRAVLTSKKTAIVSSGSSVTVPVEIHCINASNPANTKIGAAARNFAIKPFLLLERNTNPGPPLCE